MKIGLVTTIFNREKYLRAAIESVLAQAHEDFEYLLWDDGSTDGSLEIAEGYLWDSRVRVYSARHRGAGAALAGAFARVGGDYIGCVDSDDLLHPEALSKTAQYLSRRPEVGCVYTRHRLIGAAGESLGVGRECLYPYTPQRLLNSFMCGHFRLMRRGAYEAAGGIDPAYPAAIDYDLMLRMSLGTTIAPLPDVLYSYRKHPDRISERDRGVQMEYAELAKRRLLRTI